MGEWGSYDLSDLLMFSADSYVRLFERANRLWPLALLLGVALVIGLWRRPAGASPSLRWVLASAWLTVAITFHHRLYAQINLAGEAFALLFAVEAALLVLLRSSARPAHATPLAATLPGWLLITYALLLHPFFWFAVGRPWQAAELFAIAPDTTALVTLGWLLLRPMTWQWLALPIPLIWCIVSALTHVAMREPLGILVPLLALLALGARLVIAAWQRR